MGAAGIIVEYNPLHSGHLHLLQAGRAALGSDTAFVCVMSGNFVQRGDFALLRKHVRARAAVESGADLVLELPLPWAVSSAESFADGGVQVLAATGVVDHLLFGSECGDVAPLERIAAAALTPDFRDYLRRELPGAGSFAAARQRALASLVSLEDAALLNFPNNILGVEYCKALLRQNASIRPVTIRRAGSAHDGALFPGIHPSASGIRQLLRQGRRGEALSLLPSAMARAYEAEEAAGRAPVFWENSERPILARLRSMTAAEYAALDQGKEGMWNRLYDASRAAATLPQLLSAAKTKRYAMARLRRMVLWAYLGLTPGGVPAQVPYLRVLAANNVGCRLLSQMRKAAKVPVLTKPAQVRRLSPEAQKLFAWEVRATDLYTLAYPRLAAASSGAEWREGPAILGGPAPC